MSTGCKSSHSGFLDVSRNNSGLRISSWIGQLSCLTIFSTSLSAAAFLRRASGSMLDSTGSQGRDVERRVSEMRRTNGGVQLHIDQTCVSRAWPDCSAVAAVLCCWVATRQGRWPQRRRVLALWNQLASSTSCFGSSACLQSSSGILCRTAYCPASVYQ